MFQSGSIEKEALVALDLVSIYLLLTFRKFPLDPFQLLVEFFDVSGALVLECQEGGLQLLQLLGQTVVRLLTALPQFSQLPSVGVKGIAISSKFKVVIFHSSVDKQHS